MKTLHMIGIGGIGLSAVAQIMKKQGYKVSGSDEHESELTKRLEKEGITVKIGHDAGNVSKQAETVGYSLAVPAHNVELKKAREEGMITKSYAELLGELTAQKNTIAIAGTHGKTTVTGMLTKILIDAGLDPTVVIGSKMPDLDNQNFRVGKSNLMVIEACEYMETFLHFHPKYSIITNVEADHLDYYKNAGNYIKAFKKFAEKIPKEGFIVLGENVPAEIENAATCKTIRASGAERFSLKLIGSHNQENAELAYLAARALGAPEPLIRESLSRFQGTWRRLEHTGTIGKTHIYDDYGHHPTEIKVTLQALRAQHPSAKICCVFQPHQANRTRHFLADFARAFTDADHVIIPNIYTVRDSQKDIDAISTDQLVAEIAKHHPSVQNGNGLENTLKEMQKNATDYDIVIIMGAGDVTKLSRLIAEKTDTPRT